MRFELSTFEAMTIRDVPTTQISIRVSGWPDDEFVANSVVSRRRPVSNTARFLGFDD